ncbi:MAG TPA: hypothetical protein VMH28_23775 [Candidatus Acidoferrales bacterium]|nr:hypothetical protein [Candidatus Acidoferrales bacterium]
MRLALVQRLQPYLWIASAVAIAYTAWVFTGRLFEHKKLERNAARSAPSSPELDRIYGGEKLRILQFYAREGELEPGQKTLLCYGVLNAATVHIKPPVGDTQPALSRCFEIAPAQTTTFTLTARDAHGISVAHSVTVRVRVNPR